MYRQTPEGKFVNATEGSGLVIPGHNHGVAVGDVNNDGLSDVLVTQYGGVKLFINQGGTFHEIAAEAGLLNPVWGSSAAFLDFDRDGWLDLTVVNYLYVTHLNTETHTLWKQGPRGSFIDRTAEARVSGPETRGTGFGTLMADFTNSGYPGIAVVAGRVYLGGPAKDTQLGFWETYAEKNLLLANDGTGKFRDISGSNPDFCGKWNVARGLACADFDNDGGMDLLVTAIGERARLFRNVAPDRGHWLKVRAIDPQLKRDAYGAEVRIKFADGELLRLINPAMSYLSSSSPTAHFGLGQEASYDSLVVLWPDGHSEQFPGGKADQLVEIRRGEGESRE